MGDGRNAYRNLMGKSRVKRQFSRPIRRLEKRPSSLLNDFRETGF
jgi:hypothetical protein